VVILALWCYRTLRHRYYVRDLPLAGITVYWFNDRFML